MAAQAALVSAQEYLEHETKAAARHEYVAGVIYAMAGASRNHNELTRALHGLLFGVLSGRQCRNLDQDTKVWVDATGSYYYPDATVSCPPNFIDDANGVIDNPTVIVEVLSPTTANLDRGPKFAHYRMLPSLRDYVLIDSERRSVEVFSLEQDQWVVRFYQSGVARVPSVEVDLPLDELYRHVVL